MTWSRGHVKLNSSEVVAAPGRATELVGSKDGTMFVYNAKSDFDELT